MVLYRIHSASVSVLLLAEETRSLSVAGVTGPVAAVLCSAACGCRGACCSRRLDYCCTAHRMAASVRVLAARVSRSLHPSSEFSIFRPIACNQNENETKRSLSDRDAHPDSHYRGPHAIRELAPRTIENRRNAFVKTCQQLLGDNKAIPQQPYNWIKDVDQCVAAVAERHRRMPVRSSTRLQPVFQQYFKS